MKQRVTVFGGSGFLGSHVADALTDSGFDVTIFDIQDSKYLRKNQNFIKGSILDKNAVINACIGANYVYNFAGLADINVAKNRPEDAVQLNIVGNLNVLEGVRQAKVARFIYASTVYVFSESGSFYRASKQASENFVQLYWDKYQVPYTILRYGSLYGPRSNEHNNIYRLIKSALSEEIMHYPGTGDELREYINVLDAAKASVEVLKDEYKNGHLTLTGQQSLKIKDVMVMIAEMLHGKPKVSFENLDVEAHYTITPYSYNPRRGKKLTVNPFIDLGQGILECIQEIDEELHGKK